MLGGWGGAETNKARGAQHLGENTRASTSAVAERGRTSAEAGRGGSHMSHKQRYEKHHPPTHKTKTLSNILFDLRSSLVFSCPRTTSRTTHNRPGPRQKWDKNTDSTRKKTERSPPAVLPKVRIEKQTHSKMMTFSGRTIVEKMTNILLEIRSLRFSRPPPTLGLEKKRKMY